MLDFISCVFWQPVLESLLPPVAALLSATALWVASRARSTSVDARSTSQALARLAAGRRQLPALNESAPGARDRRK